MCFEERPRLHLQHSPLFSLSCALWAAGMLLALLFTAALPAARAQAPDDGTGAFHTGHYRDLFAEQGHSPEQTRAKIEKAFQQLFHGDPQDERVYFEAG